MQNAIKGTLLKVLPTENGTSKAGKDWSKRAFVIKTDDDYPKEVCFSLFGEKVTIIDNYKVGDSIDVSFNLSSREYNGKYYHNIDAWRITAAGAEAVAAGGSEWKSSKDTSNLPF